MWFGFYPVWSIEIHGNTDREMIELRFENADGTWILNESKYFEYATKVYGSFGSGISNAGADAIASLSASKACCCASPHWYEQFDDRS